MSGTETKTHHTRPETAPSQEVIDGGLSDFYEICGLVDEQILAEGGDLDAINPGRYWMMVADTGHRYTEVTYQQPESMAQKFASECLAYSPVALIAHMQLGVHEQAVYEGRPTAGSQKAVADLKRTTATFTNKVRSLVLAEQNLTPHQLNRAINSCIVKSGLASRLPGYHKEIVGIIRGIQSETAMLAALSHTTGGRARFGDEAEDLTGGDIVLQLTDEKGILVDVKSGLAEIRRYEPYPGAGYAIINGRLVIANVFSDDESTSDTFTPSDAAIKRHAYKLTRIISEVSTRSDLRMVEF